jgi:hypothetical protein
MLAKHAEYDKVTGRTFHDRPSTLPLDSIVGFGMALRRLVAKYNLSRPEKNADQIDGHPRRQPMHLATMARMQKLSAHVTRRVQTYGQDFISRYNIAADAHPALSGLDQIALSERFGSRVYAPHPEPDGSRHYAGIVTIFLPNVSAIDLEPDLTEAGYDLSYVRAGQQALRISLHYFHETDDIDGLFDCILAAHHRAFQKVRTKSYFRYTETIEPLSKTSPKVETE